MTVARGGTGFANLVCPHFIWIGFLGSDPKPKHPQNTIENQETSCRRLSPKNRDTVGNKQNVHKLYGKLL